jgi:hypothetical protein
LNGDGKAGDMNGLCGFLDIKPGAALNLSAYCRTTRSFVLIRACCHGDICCFGRLWGEVGADRRRTTFLGSIEAEGKMLGKRYTVTLKEEA